METNDAKRTHETKSRIAMAKAAFNKKKTLFISKLDFKELMKCCTGAESCMVLKHGYFRK
jgi:hypothetical protein